MERVLQKAITHAYALNSITYSHNHQFHNQKLRANYFIVWKIKLKIDIKAHRR